MVYSSLIKATRIIFFVIRNNLLKSFGYENILKGSFI